MTLDEFYAKVDQYDIRLSDYSAEVGFVYLQSKLLNVRDALDSLTDLIIKATRTHANHRHASHQHKALMLVTGDAAERAKSKAAEQEAENWRAAIIAAKLRRDTLLDTAQDIRLYARMLERTMPDPGGVPRGRGVDALPPKRARIQETLPMTTEKPRVEDDVVDLEFR